MTTWRIFLYSHCANRISRLKMAISLSVTSKIVSKAEGRMVNLATVTPSERARELARQSEKDPRVVELMLGESNEILRVRVGTIVVEHRLGFVCANAGIDHSNVDPPPSPPQILRIWGSGKERRGAKIGSCSFQRIQTRRPRAIRERVESKTGKQIGVMIINSHGRAWRIGTSACASA